MPVPVANVFAEIRSLTRDGVMPSHLVSTLQHRLESVKDMLQGETVVALALLTSARGDWRQARQLMESVEWLDAVPAEVQDYARGWLLTDAAAEGDWARLQQLQQQLPLPRGGEGRGEGRQLTPAIRFLTHLATRALGEPTPLAPDDWYQLPVEARRFSETFKPETPTRTDETQLEDPVASLLRQLLALTPFSPSGVEGPGKHPVATSPPLHSDGTEEAARAVTSVLGSRHLRDRLLERATMLGVGSPDDALEDLRAICEDALGNALTQLDANSDSLLRHLAARRREVLIEELYGRLDVLTDKCEARTTPPMTEVWREFVAIRACYARAVALSEPAEKGWPHHVVLRLTRYFGTWLRLTKKERIFAHAVFRFLEAEATRAGDDTSARLAKASAELCLPFKPG